MFNLKHKRNSNLIYMALEKKIVTYLTGFVSMVDLNLPSKRQWQFTVAFLNVSSWNHGEILNLKRYLFTHITFMPFEWIHGNQFVNINNAIPLTSKVNSIRCKHLFYIATWLDLFCIWKHFKTFLHFLFRVSSLWLLW